MKTRTTPRNNRRRPLRRRIASALLALFCASLAHCQHDGNGDDVVHLRLVGDSLIKLYYFGVPWGTGETLKTLLPANWEVVNLAEPGRRLIEGSPPSCWAQAEQAIADHADVVVLACGTNDLAALGGVATATQLLEIRDLLEDAGVAVYVSSIPPRGATPQAVAQWANLADAANDILFASPGAIDLTTGYDPLDRNCYFGGLHFQESCNLRRACTIADYLLGELPAGCGEEDGAAGAAPSG